jgi:hypothetical protein
MFLFEAIALKAKTQAGQRTLKLLSAMDLRARSVAKPESLGKFLLIVIKVNQIGVIVHIRSVNPAHPENDRNDDYNRPGCVPQIGF